MSPVLVKSNWMELDEMSDYSLSILDEDIADCGSANTIASLSPSFTTDNVGSGGLRTRVRGLNLDGENNIVGKWLQLTASLSGAETACCQIVKREQRKDSDQAGDVRMLLEDSFNQNN